MAVPLGNRTSNAAIRSRGTEVAVATLAVTPGTALHVPAGVRLPSVSMTARSYTQDASLCWSYWQMTVIAVPHFLSTSWSEADIGPGAPTGFRIVVSSTSGALDVAGGADELTVVAAPGTYSPAVS